MQRPSSLKAATPAAFNAPIGAISSPAKLLVMQPQGCTLTTASVAMCRRRYSIWPELSAAGLVLGIGTMAVKPPAAAARVPVAMVSAAVLPG